MTPRIDYMTASPEAFQAVYGLEQYVSEKSGLDHRLIHLIKIRASQINGCAYCIDMHLKEARRLGFSEQWIGLICAWRESPIFTPQERALLAWTEVLTQVSTEGAPDDVFEPLQEHFTEDEIAKLTVAIGTINVWNRIAVGFRAAHPVDQAA